MIGIDGLVSDHLLDLRDCLLAAFQLPGYPAADRPREVCVLTGESGLGFLSIGTAEDRCCSGFAWVRVAAVSPKIPQEGVDVNGCGITSWSVTLEMGAARCHPIGDANAGPTCAQMEAVALQVQQDAAAMRRALCCWAPELPAYPSWGAVGPWQPFGPEGGCTGGTMQVQYTVDGCECSEA